MKIFLLCPRSFGANTYLLVSGKHAIAVDPCVTVGAISKALDEAEARLEGILLTHGHFDHTASVDKLRETFPVPLTVHAEDAIMLTDGRTNGYFDFASLLYYLSVSAAFLYFTVRVYERRRYHG